MPVKLFAVYHGYCEWYIARRLSRTSTTTHALIKALIRHYVDLKHDYFHIVRKFMRRNYNYRKSVQEHARSEAKDMKE